MAKPIVGIMYDFDKTLSTTDMQNYDFIPNLGMTPEEFWGATTEFTEKTGVADRSRHGSGRACRVGETGETRKTGREGCASAPAALTTATWRELSGRAGTRRRHSACSRKARRQRQG